ncbi:MAG: hypothetical protein FWH20_10100 [Oscillospiraceae bacterium]|nr:hypothetical protein [Oscillospiraceae bacterium]
MSKNYDNHDKRELLKLKQGLIEDSEVIKKDESAPPELHGAKKVENFFYHYKITVIMVVFVSVLVGLFVYELAKTERRDIDFMLLTASYEAAVLVFEHEGDIARGVEMFTPDYDGNGRVRASAVLINLWNEMTRDTAAINQTRLSTEIRGGKTRLIIADKEAFERIVMGTDYNYKDILVNLGEIYGHGIEDDVFFKIQGSFFAEQAGIDERCPDDMYIAVLSLNVGSKAQQEAHEQALEVLDNIVNRRVLNEVIVGRE